MTAFTPNELWRTMPGWGITANLLPPEIVTARRVKVLRKFALTAVVAVLLLGAAGYLYALSQKNAANSELASAAARTAVLHTQQAKYGQVVTLAGDISAVTAQLSQVLANDVDAHALLSKITSAQPRGGTISSMQMTMVTGTGATVSDGAGVLDSSGHPHVGSLTVMGTTNNLSNVAAYVVRLDKIAGVVTAYPTSVTSDDKKNVTYTIQATLTDQVFSHKYDAVTAPAGTTPGGK